MLQEQYFLAIFVLKHWSQVSTNFVRALMVRPNVTESKSGIGVIKLNTLLHLYKVLWLDVSSHTTSFSQSGGIISRWNFAYDIGSRLDRIIYCARHDQNHQDRYSHFGLLYNRYNFIRPFVIALISIKSLCGSFCKQDWRIFFLEVGKMEIIRVKNIHFAEIYLLVIQTCPITSTVNLSSKADSSSLTFEGKRCPRLECAKTSS